MSAINRRSLMPLPSCCKTSSEKTRALAAWCMASQAFRSACRSSWKSFSRCRRHIEHDGGKINGGEPPTQRGSDSRDAGSASIVGPDSRKRASRGTPDFLSLDTHRWGLHLLQGGRPQGGADASAAAWASRFIADVRGSLPPVVRPLSPCRARLPGLRTQRLARPENLCVYVRSLCGSHESLHRGARPFAIHALHAGLRWPGRFSHGPGPSRPDRGPRSEEHTSELQSQSNLVCRLLLENKNSDLFIFTIPKCLTHGIGFVVV